MNWSRLYLAPGMGHCGGGPVALDSFDMLSALVDWVEKGTAPASVTATGRALPGRSRPLCAYPQHAHYKGQRRYAGREELRVSQLKTILPPDRDRTRRVFQTRLQARLRAPAPPDFLRTFSRNQRKRLRTLALLYAFCFA